MPAKYKYASEVRAFLVFRPATQKLSLEWLIDLECIRVEKPRYIRDQVILIKKAIKDTPLKAIDEALDFCIKNKLYRATDFQDAINHYKKDKQVTEDAFTVKVSSMSAETLEKIKITPKIRDMSEYIKALGGTDDASND